jgi:hypothetical protein
VDLPVNPPIPPMLAKRVDELPGEGDWIFEPKWDGFRALVFRDADEIFIQSRDGKPLNRYFPELLEPLRAAPKLFRASGVTTIASNLGFTRSSIFAKLAAIFLSGWWDTNTGLMSTLLRTLARHLHYPFHLEFSQRSLQLAERLLLSGDRCNFTFGLNR